MNSVVAENNPSLKVESGNIFSRVTNVLLPPGSIAANAFTLAGSSIGAGILALPLAFSYCGIVIASIYLFVVTLLTIFSVYLLGCVAKKIGVEDYDEISHALTGRWGNYYLSSIQWINGVGSCIAYVICIDGLILSFQNGVEGWWGSVACKRVVLSLVWLFGMVPVSMPKHLNSIRYVAFGGAVFVLWLVLCVIIHSAQNGLLHGVQKDRKLFNGGNSSLAGLSMIIFAYLCQPNVLEVYTESSPKTVARLTISGALSMGFCGLMYWLTGFFGYVDFGPNVKDNLLKQYNPLQDFKFLVAYVGLTVKICVAFALHLFPCRDSFYQLMKWKLDDVPIWINTALCGGICVVSLLVGMFFPSIQVLFGLLGSVCGSSLGFIFPSIYLMYSGNFSWKESGPLLYICTHLLLYVGVVGVVFGTGSVIFTAASG